MTHFTRPHDTQRELSIEPISPSQFAHLVLRAAWTVPAWDVRCGIRA